MISAKTRAAWRSTITFAALESWRPKSAPRPWAVAMLNDVHHPAAGYGDLFRFCTYRAARDCFNAIGHTDDGAVRPYIRLVWRG